MTSNMLSGDRRWASAKRGGMTVLGKVVVPKPINLPSQRSENHGLDPNTEIVPKGTLSWGSKSTSAWGSVSPNADGRPSSGSGTRPSTASSDRGAHDTISTDSNSRPASASGVLSSNQTSLASMRPRSADTRPGSSQLSRFAEHSDHSGAWTAPGTAEKLGVAPFKNDEFSLASGDFPTLGSGKESSGRDTDPQDPSSQGCPSSPSGGVRRGHERIEALGAVEVLASENLKNGAVNSFQRNTPPHSDDGVRTGMENWQGNPQAYPNPPPHFDAWHGAPMNNPQGGVWFRGPPGGAPYGNPILPMEHFPYYRPQMPASGLPNTQPGAPHPKNGDMFRPHMPNMPIRPGFFPAPVAYDGYYGPPLGYCAPNERDVQYMGIMPGPSAYHRYPVQGAHEPGNHHSAGFGPNSKNQGAEQAEAGRPLENRGPYKVLLKHHEEPKSDDSRNDCRLDRHKDEENDRRKLVGEDVPLQAFENQGSASIPVKKSDSDDPQPLLALPKDPSLIRKIEGLNKKARGSDGHVETVSSSNSTNKKNLPHASARLNKNTKDTERIYSGAANPVSLEEPAYKSLDKAAGANTARRLEPRIDQHGRGRNNPLEIEGRQKKLLSLESPAPASALNLKASNIQEPDHHISTEIPDNINEKTEGPAPILDKEQRAKMRELAQQRTRQLQEEEEERTKKQMAKARAKLEELNRRTQAAESASTEKAENKVEEPERLSESLMGGKRHENSKSTVGSKPNVVSQKSERDIIRVEKPPSPVVEKSPEPPIVPTPSPNPPKASENISKHKRAGFKQKQHPGITEASKIQAEAVASVTASAGIQADEVLQSGHLAVPVNPIPVVDPLQPRKKHHKNGRNKQKAEDKSAPSTSRETLPVISPESSQSKESDLGVPAQHSEQHLSSPNEDSHGRLNSQWKSQQSRRMPKNAPNNKSGEKFHGNEAVVWAPVRSQNKAEVVAIDEARLETSADDFAPPVKPDNQVQYNPKNKRAEIERYIPKPVAKEMAHHANEPVVEAVSGTEEPPSHQNTGIALERKEVSAESRNGGGRHNNKQGKGHGSWRQRGTAELATSNVTQNVQISNVPQQPQLPNQTLVREQPKYNDDWYTGDDWPVSSEPIQPVPVIKDQGPTSRGKRHAVKGHKNTEKKNHSDETDKNHIQSPAIETSQVIDLSAASKENRGVVERQAPHWQPKSQELSANNQRGNRRGSNQNVGSDVAWVNKADSNRQSTHEDNTTEAPGQFHHDQAPGQFHHDQPIPKRWISEESSYSKHQEVRRERKPAPPKGQQGNPVEQCVDSDPRQEHQSSHFRKNGNQNARYVQSQSQDSRGDWNYSGENIKSNPALNRERTRHNHNQNPRYEYQPVGSNNPVGPKDGPDDSGARVRGRGQNHLRRGAGNFYGRQSGFE